MRAQAMPWPVLDPRRARRMPALQALAGLAPPNLVLIDADGKVLANGWQGRRYEGLQPVLKQWTKQACAQQQARCPPESVASSHARLSTHRANSRRAWLDATETGIARNAAGHCPALPLRRPALGLAHERLEQRQRLFADMVLDALGITARGIRVHAQRQQETLHGLMALAAGLRQRLAFRGQEHATVRPLHHPAVTGQAPQHLRHRRLGHAQARGDVDLAGLAAVGQQVRDQLDIVLHQLHPVRLAHLPEALDLALGLDQGGALQRCRIVGLAHACACPSGVLRC
ncbi:hypothetical protein G6F59_013036 [Rhizopus arrhizus]|nr:hypothetical protein G6F59_013036 [Rhizopus arrhizus]